MQPKTRYARNGDVNIAYQVVGDGPLDLLWIPGFVSHVELYWGDPAIAGFIRRLASFSRLIVFDKRGTGLSDPVSGVPTLEQRMEDAIAVLDAVGSERPALFGISEGGPVSVMLAATFPERVRALALYGTIARGRQDAEHPWGVSEQSIGRVRAALEQWGEGGTLDVFAPSVAAGGLHRMAWGTFERAAASPGMAGAVIEAWLDVDLEPLLPLVRVPTLVLHRAGDPFNVEGGRFIAERVPDARYVELPGDDHMPWIGDSAAIADEIEEFLTGARHASEPTRMLATVLFTDIVDSTATAAALGDARWRETLERHDELVRRELGRYGGREVKTTGDGFLAAFDGPARAIRCAGAICASVRELGLEARAGVHTGECEIRGDDVAGMAVHIGARVGALARPGEVLVSGTVKELVVGSGIPFADRGARKLKGVPGEWRLFAVAGDDAVRSEETEPGTRLVPRAADQRDEPAMARMARRAPAVSRAFFRLARRERAPAGPGAAGPAREGGR